MGVVNNSFTRHLLKYNYTFQILRHCSDDGIKMKILNVAEKNDAAKSLSEVMTRGRYRKREGLSRYNKIYEFEHNLFNQNCTMVMTSVSGHLLNLEFVGQYKKWHSCNPKVLFDVPVQKFCPEDYNNIKKTLEREVRGCQKLIIWTDGDREGENIGFEIIQVCRAVKPNIPVLRARFSEITPQAIARACNNLNPPDQNTTDAVDLRTELDLRIGAAFTRFQTLRLQKIFPAALGDQLISYGSCQFPTLGFVVERYKQVQAFVPEPFWKLRVTHKQDDESIAEFNWKRHRLFNHLACLALYEQCIESPEAEVVDVKSKSKSKWRPQPLETVEMEKLASRKLRINAKETMKIAEKLYTQGFISYPRTETNMFPKEYDLQALIEDQTRDPNWGEFASQLLEHGPHPRNGHKTDNAHPPIHPIKYTCTLQGNEQRLYEFIVRHFLATCSQDAQGHETTAEISVAEERFIAQGLMIIARNYLDVYPYEKWNAKVMPVYHLGDIFQPTSIEMNAGETNAPPLLTEADLIALMDKHGIGTDATHADHIETIKSRMYVGVRPDGKFVPGQLGMGLVEGYDSMGYEMSKPNLRAELESDLKEVCQGRKQKSVVLAHHIKKYRDVFVEACRQAIKLDEALSQYLGEAQTSTESDREIMEQISVKPCSQCGQEMMLRTKKDNKGYYIGCMGYPDCRSAIWLPDSVLEATVLEDVCNQCQPGPVHMMKFKFKRGSVPPMIPTEYVGCIGGCDEMLSETLGIRPAPGGSRATPNHRQPSLQDSGFGSTFSNSNSTSRNTQNNSNSSRTDHNSSRNTQNVNNSARNNQNFFTSSSGSRTASSFQDSGMNSFNSTNSSRGNRTPTHSNRQSGYNNQSRGNNSGLSMHSQPEQSHQAPDGDNASNGNSIVCSCGEDAMLLTVRKEGPNTGRQFYKCRKPTGSGCTFFLWADADPNESGGQRNSTSTFNSSQANNSYSGGSDTVSKCKCGQAAKSLTVQKEGANKGRPFYSCPKPRGEGCNFFQWGDEPPGGGEGHQPGDGGGWGGGGTSWGRGEGSGSRGRGRGGRAGPSTGTDGPKKRKCGICGEEGHNKRNCPHRE